jgi:hypothetical protein
MEIMNKTYKKIIKSDLKLTTILHNDLSFNKSINFLDYNSKMGNPQNFSKKNKLFFSKNCITPSRLLKNSIINLSTKNNNNKIDASTQKNFYKKNTKNFLKILIEKIPNKNNNEIDYVLESPHRGVEKIQYSHDIKGKNFFKPVFIDNAYNGYFCKNKEKINFTMNNNCKKIFIDKYNEINKNKEINNPLKKLSQLSGLSCYKLRKFIDYSLNNKPKHKFIFLGKKEKNKKNFLKKDNRYNNFKNIYSFITLKSKKNIKFKMIKDNFPLDNEGSLDNNVIYPKRIYEIKRFIDISKNDNDIYK